MAYPNNNYSRDPNAGPLTTTNPNAPLHGDHRDFGKGGRYGPTGENGPTQIGTEKGRNQFDYWETDPDKVNAYLAQHPNDPKLLAAAQRGDQALDHELHSRGIRVPEHFKAAVGQDGRVLVKEMSWWDKHSNWAMPALMMGAVIATGGIAAGMGGGAGGATGATTAATAGGVLPSTAVSSLGALVPATSSILPAVGATTAATTAAAGGYSALTNLAKNPKTYETIAKGLGGYANAKGNERMDTLEGLQTQDQTQIYANRDQRDAERDAMKQLAIAKYNSSGGYTPGAGADPRYSSGIAAPTASSAAQTQAAKDMERILLERINNPFKPTDSTKYTKPGKGEKIAGYAQLGLTGYSALKGLL